MVIIKNLKKYNVIMLIAAVVYCFWLIWRIFLPMEIDANEGWNVLHIQSLLNQHPLYPSLDKLVINNYPPLSFYFIGALHKVNVLDIITLGRIISYISTLIIAFCIYYAVLLFKGSRASAIFASLWFLATMGRFFWGYMGMNDPSLFALAIMAVGFVFFIKAYYSNQSLYFSLIIMVISGFFKHNHIVLPLSCIIFVVYRDKIEAIKMSAFGVVLCFIGLLICYFSFGYDFFHHLFMPRITELRLSLINLGRLQWVMPALIIVVYWVVVQRKSQEARFIAIMILIGFISNFLQKMGEGVGNNAQFELVFVVSIGLGLTIDALVKADDKRLMLVFAVLMLRLVLSTRNEPYLFFTPQFHRDYAVSSDLALNEIERVKQIEGKVACSIKSICFYAGKSFEYDNFYVYQLIRTGKKTQDEIDMIVAKQKIRFVPIDENARWLIR